MNFALLTNDIHFGVGVAFFVGTGTIPNERDNAHAVLQFWES